MNNDKEQNLVSFLCSSRQDSQKAEPADMTMTAVGGRRGVKLVGALRRRRGGRRRIHLLL